MVIMVSTWFLCSNRFWILLYIVGGLLIGGTGIGLLSVGGNLIPTYLSPAETVAEDGRRLTPEEQSAALSLKVKSSPGYAMSIAGGACIGFVLMGSLAGTVYYSCCALRFEETGRRTRVLPSPPILSSVPPPTSGSDSKDPLPTHSPPTTGAPPPTSDSIAIQIYPLQVPSPLAAQKT